MLKRNEHLNYEVRTHAGIVRGTRCGDPQITVFRGVPYAKPPVGELRFMEPQPLESWDGIRNCTQFAPTAVMPDMKDEFYQNEFHLYPMPSSEDCLYLNIWTPAKAAGEKLPVMFWIHGGGNFQGYSHEMEFDGEALCKRGVILVTVGYRLSTMGFLAHPALSARAQQGASGQFGMLDLVAALDWVRANINAFGGDSECITVFGQSAGGADVVALLASPLTEGKFHRAVIMSGLMANGNWKAPTQEEADANGKEFCERHNLPLDALLSLDAQKLTNRFYFDARGNRLKDGLPMMHNIADGYFLREEPITALLAGRSHPMPIMIGTVFGDGGMFAGGELSEQEQEAHAVTSTHVAAAALLARGTEVYTYFFNRDLPGNEVCPPTRSYHSSDLWYVFGTLGRSTRPFDGRDWELANTAMDYWANFAKNGNPNCASQPLWTPYTGEAPLTMVFGNADSHMCDLTRNEQTRASVGRMLDSFRTFEEQR